MTHYPDGGLYPTSNTSEVPVKTGAFIVIGTDTFTKQKALVAIATSFPEVTRIVGEDYLKMMVDQKLNPINYPLKQGIADDESEYFITGYSWDAVPIQLDLLLNMAL
jgi:hypothetical protein